MAKNDHKEILYLQVFFYTSMIWRRHVAYALVVVLLSLMIGQVSNFVNPQSTLGDIPAPQPAPIPSSSPDFSLSLSSNSLTIQQGGSGSSTLAVTSLSDFSSSVSLSVSGNPVGVTVVFSPDQVTPTSGGLATSMLTISVDSSASTGTYALTVSGVSGSLTHTTVLILTVTATTPSPTQTTAEVTFQTNFPYDPNPPPAGTASFYVLILTVDGKPVGFLDMSRGTLGSFTPYFVGAVKFTWDVGTTHTYAWESLIDCSRSCGNNGGHKSVWESTTGLASGQSGTITVTTRGSIIATYRTEVVTPPTTTPSIATDCGGLTFGLATPLPAGICRHSGYRHFAFTLTDQKYYAVVHGILDVRINQFSTPEYHYGYTLSLSGNTVILRPWDPYRGGFEVDDFDLYVYDSNRNLIGSSEQKAGIIEVVEIVAPAPTPPTPTPTPTPAPSPRGSYGGYDSWDEYCKATYGSDHHYDASRDLCVQSVSTGDKEQVCKATYGSDYHYDASRDLCVKSTPTPIPTPVPTQPLTQGTISVSTDRPSYNFGDRVVLEVKFSGVGSGENIAVSVTDPTGKSVVTRTITTDRQGLAGLQFKIAESSKTGTYQVVATSSVGDENYEDSTQFTVKSQSSKVSIISVESTDQQGNPVSSFSRGTNGFVKVILSVESSTPSLVTVNLFDSDQTSLGIGSFKTTLSPGESEMILSFFIPNDAVAGSANIYANAFSDWPSRGGTPLTGESSTSTGIK